MDGLYPILGEMSCTMITSVSLRRGSTKHDGTFVHVVGEFMPEK